MSKNDIVTITFDYHCQTQQNPPSPPRSPSSSPPHSFSPPHPSSSAYHHSYSCVTQQDSALHDTGIIKLLLLYSQENN